MQGFTLTVPLKGTSGRTAITVCPAVRKSSTYFFLGRAPRPSKSNGKLYAINFDWHRRTAFDRRACAQRVAKDCELKADQQAVAGIRQDA